MKTILTFLLISICSITFGQPSQKQKEASTTIVCAGCDLKFLENRLSVPFDELNGAQIQEANNAAKYAHKTDSIKWVLIRSMVGVLERQGKIDPSRISVNGDSLKVTPQGIDFILKPKKK